MHDFCNSAIEFEFCGCSAFQFFSYFVSLFLCLFDGLVSGILSFNDLEYWMKKEKKRAENIEMKISALWMLWTKNERTELKCRYEGMHGHAPINQLIYICSSSIDFYLKLQLQCVYALFNFAIRVLLILPLIMHKIPDENGVCVCEFNWFDAILTKKKFWKTRAHKQMK